MVKDIYLTSSGTGTQNRGCVTAKLTLTVLHTPVPKASASR